VSDDEVNLFEDQIYSYTRAQALEDGVLIHVPNGVYKYHTAVTAEVPGLVGEERMREFLVASVSHQVKSWETGGILLPAKLTFRYWTNLPSLTSTLRQSISATPFNS
jgi:hypothetical protein